MTTTAAQLGQGYRRGDPGYRRITLALFAAGMATFSGMYGVQAVLPQISAELGVSEASAALAVSAATGALALMVIPASVLSERYGRTQVMIAAALLSGIVGLLIPLAPSMPVLLTLRVLQGITLAGVPATAMAYLAEEVDAGHLGAAMGRYIAGTTLGGLCGRLVASSALDVTTWRWALEIAAVVAIGFAVLLARTAPPSQHFVSRRIGARVVTGHLLEHLRRPELVAMYVTALVLMGGFVGVYNMLGFRLLARPFALPESIVGLVFLMYLCGTVSSRLAGVFADRFGQRRALLVSELAAVGGVLLTIVDQLACVLIGVALFTAGFFGAHAVASAAVGRLATRHRAEASGLYLSAYYLGGSVVGALVAVVYTARGWSAAAVTVAVLVGLALVVAASLRWPARG